MSPSRKKKRQQAAPAARSQDQRNQNSGSRQPASATPVPTETPAPRTTAATTAPATGYRYVDIAAVRIQTWLNFTPKLKVRRGGSTVLQIVTSRAEIERLRDEVLALGADWADPAWEWNPEAGEISGVVSLRFPASPDGAADDARAELLARAVAADVRRKLPALGLTAGWVSAPTYLAAYPAIVSQTGGHLDFPATPMGHPSAAPCDLCGRAAAVLPVEAPVHCTDCDHRVPEAGFQSARCEGDLPLAQAMILRRLHVATTGFSNPKDFETLAKSVDAKGDAATHIATIMADGNRIGALMADLARGKRTMEKAQVVRALDLTTKEALGRAVRDTCRHPDDDGYAFIAHLVGGDDAMISVPASRAWDFVQALSRRFTEAAGASLTDEDGTKLKPLTELLNGRPSLSMGMVFHHNSYPIVEVTEQAEHLLGEAKRAVDGEIACVTFLDFTADGGELADAGWEQPTVLERTVCFAPLGVERQGSGVTEFDEDRLRRLAAVRAIPASQRATLRHLVADALLRLVAEAGDSPEDGDVSHLALHRRVVTMAIPAVVEVLGAEEKFTLRQLRSMRQALDVARWWPSAEGPHGDALSEARYDEEALTDAH